MVKLLSASQAKLAQIVPTLPAFQTSMPKDRPPDTVDLDLAARNVVKIHVKERHHVALTECLDRVCEERGVSREEAIVEVLDPVGP